MKAKIKSQTQQFVIELTYSNNGEIESANYLRVNKAGNDPISLADFDMIAIDPNAISINVLAKGLSQVEQEVEFETTLDLSILFDNYGNVYRRLKE